MKRILLAGLVVLGLVSSSQAGMLALDGFNLGTTSSVATNRVIGWAFFTNESITVDTLGFWDEGSDGLVASHQVGIWDGTGSILLGSVTVQSGTGSSVKGPVIAGGTFRFESLVTPIHLSLGQEYVIGALTDDNDLFALRTSGVTSQSQVTYVQPRQSDSNSGFVKPTEVNSFDNQAYFGPNFTIATVPEPSTFALLTIGGLALAGYGWRRKRQQAA